MMTFITYIRSFTFIIVASIYTIIYSIIARPVFWFVSEHSMFKITSVWSYVVTFLLKYICGLRYRIEGLENINQNKPSIVISRHESAWETMAHKVIFHNAIFVLKKELLGVPVVKQGLISALSIVIDRSKGVRSIKYVLTETSRRLKQGYKIIIFPEGTRTPHKSPNKIKKGVCLIVKENNVGSYLVSHNAGNFWEKKTLLIKPGVIDVKISKQHNYYNQPIEEIQKSIDEYFIEHSKN